MLTAPDHLLGSHMGRDGLKNEGFYHLCRDWGWQAGSSLGPPSCPLWKTGVTFIFFFPVLRHHSWLPWPFKNDHEHPSCGICELLNTCGWIPSGVMVWWMSSFPGCSVIIPWPSVHFLSNIPVPWSTASEIPVVSCWLIVGNLMLTSWKHSTDRFRQSIF